MQPRQIEENDDEEAKLKEVLKSESDDNLVDSCAMDRNF